MPDDPMERRSTSQPPWEGLRRTHRGALSVTMVQLVQVVDARASVAHRLRLTELDVAVTGSGALILRPGGDDG